MTIWKHHIADRKFIKAINIQNPCDMAKQGFHKYERNFGNVIFYRRCGKWFFRKNSSLSSKTVKTAKAFANSRASAHRLGIGSRVAASVYRELPEAWKMFELYQKLTGLAARLQKEGKTITEIRPLLEKQLYDLGYRKEIDYPAIKPSTVKIVIRSAKECKTEEVTHKTTQLIKQIKEVKQKTTQLIKHVKLEKPEATQPIKRRIRRRIKKVKRNYNIRRNRNQQLLRLVNYNISFFNPKFSGNLQLVTTFQAAPP